MILRIALFALMAVAAAIGLFLMPKQQPPSASLIQLIATPWGFDGRRVQIIGFVRLEFEGDAIYLHRDDEAAGIQKNGLWLEVEGLSAQERREFDGRYVLVEGTFSMQDRGHFGLWSGAIRDITRMLPKGDRLPEAPIGRDQIR
ncbi:hypothetical protein ACQ86G_12630 [Roseateles chitinivorans]|uniref:hypothetical protein n=1 Tax=Roseateles chitinivorans TaxID=2917965 RepID=UPI003D666146